MASAGGRCGASGTTRRGRSRESGCDGRASGPREELEGGDRQGGDPAPDGWPSIGSEAGGVSAGDGSSGGLRPGELFGFARSDAKQDGGDSGDPAVDAEVLGSRGRLVGFDAGVAERAPERGGEAPGERLIVEDDLGGLGGVDEDDRLAWRAARRRLGTGDPVDRFQELLLDLRLVGADGQLEPGLVGDDVPLRPGADRPDATTAGSNGFVSRETIDWSVTTVRAAIRRASIVLWGAAPWPPLP